jgi:ubiquinone/menaquinone biosynthesis C-methylase UbiE
LSISPEPLQARSIAFDPAVEYYDRTRALRPDAQRAVIEVLLADLSGRGRALEVGVGTGRIALDLHAGGQPMAGVDLSLGMLRRLVEKAGGEPPFPLAVGDATALPFPDRRFGAVLVCHVFHLIPDWRQALAEAVRMLRPGGVILVELTERQQGAASAVNRHFWSLTSTGARTVPGLRDWSELAQPLADRGFRARELEPVVERLEISLGEVIRRLEAGMFASCWSLEPAELRSAGAATREWARERFGSLDAPHSIQNTITWHAYDAPQPSR